MNKREKEAYLREYSILKAQGKPFFPYAVAKDSAMAAVVLLTIVLMSLILGAELVPLATIGIPTLCMILLILLPFYDRGPERRPERRPIATAAGIFTIVAMAYLTYLGAAAGSPTEIEAKAPSDLTGAALQEYEAGKLVAAQSGCLACHKFGENGNDGPGPELSEIGGRLKRDAIARTLQNPTAPMPSYKDLPPDKFSNLVSFLSQLK